MESYRGVSIVYEDNHLLVVVKPPNMPTQADDSGDADLHGTMKAYIAERYNKPAGFGESVDFRKRFFRHYRSKRQNNRLIAELFITDRAATFIAAKLCFHAEVV